MRFELRYLNVFSYPEPVRESQNVLRASPASGPSQHLLGYRVGTRPASRVFSYWDYWGTRVDAFGVREPHLRLEVLAESGVETASRPSPVDPAPRTVVGETEFREAHLEYLGPSRHTAWTEPLRRRAEEAAEGADDVTGAVRALEEAVGDWLSYAPGTTYVGMDVNEVLSRGKGVCQDYAHLLIAACRSLEIPARYVSGYLYATDPASGSAPEDGGLSGLKTHAWVEVAVPGFGWWARDPTNRLEVGERHIEIGHGRDYDDVTPLRGVYHGPAVETLEVSVEIRRLG